MARVNLKLKKPVTDFDFDVDENSLESNGWVRIVRCKDCKWWHDAIQCSMYSEGMDTSSDWFCADGEREVQE
jgi:hypothetical protein